MPSPPPSPTRCRPNDTDEASVTAGLADVALDARARPRTIDGGATATLVVEAAARGRRTARDARVCVRVPARVSVRRPRAATLRRGRLCWRIERLAAGKRRVLRLRIVTPDVTRPRTVVVPVTVSGRGVRTRRTRVVLRILPAARPPRFTG